MDYKNLLFIGGVADMNLKRHFMLSDLREFQRVNCVKLKKWDVVCVIKERSGT